MTEPTTALTRHELEAKIVEKAWADGSFRAELIADPAGTFEKYSGIPAAQLPRIVIHAETAGEWHIVLPAKRDGGGALSDDELESIAGGAFQTTAVSPERAAQLSMVQTIGGQKKPGQW